MAPLNKLTTTKPFKWTLKAHHSFSQLKEVLTTALVLHLLDFTLPFMVETDTSGVDMGAILSQKGHPIAFFSKSFPPKFPCASTYVRELFVITAVVKKWRQYLLGHRFIILTDHQSLKELMTQVVQTSELQMYLACLMGYDYCT